MRRRTIEGFAALAVAFAAPPALAAADAPANVIAAQIRLQGHRCDKPVKAARDLENSKPDVAAWVLKCGNAAYGVQLIPHRAARVELLAPPETRPR